MTASYKIALAASGLLLLIVIVSLILRSEQQGSGDPLAAVDTPAASTNADGQPVGPPQRDLTPAADSPTRINFSRDPLPPLGTPAPGNTAPGDAGVGGVPEPKPIGSLTVGRRPFESDNPLFGEVSAASRIDIDALLLADTDTTASPTADNPEARSPEAVRIALGPTDRVTPAHSDASAPAKGIPAPPREPPLLRLYTIESGDNLSSIALATYGSANKWVDVAQANPLVDPNRLRVGQEIKLPDLSVKTAGQTSGDASGGTSGGGDLPRRGATYTVKTGDNLNNIAKQFYGSSSKWELLFHANRQIIGDEPGNLQVGMKLLIPPPDNGAN